MDWLTCGPDWGVWLWAAAEMASQSLQMTWCVCESELEQCCLAHFMKKRDSVYIIVKCV